MQRERSVGLPVSLFCALVGLAPEAQAYLDPSTGSMILSAIVGIFATLGLAVKTYWYKLKHLLTRRAPTLPTDRAQPSADRQADPQIAPEAGQRNRTT